MNVIYLRIRKKEKEIVITNFIFEKIDNEKRQIFFFKQVLKIKRRINFFQTSFQTKNRIISDGCIEYL